WRIRGHGGRPDGLVTLMQCLAGARSFDGCALGTRDFAYAPIDRQVGVSWETRYRFRRYLHLAGGGLVDCAARPCSLLAVDTGGPFARSDRILTRFTPCPNRARPAEGVRRVGQDGRMLSKLDDYPVHQTVLPLSIPNTSDRHSYDRYWFNGY